MNIAPNPPMTRSIFYISKLHFQATSTFTKASFKAHKKQVRQDIKAYPEWLRGINQSKDDLGRKKMSVRKERERASTRET